MQVQRGCERWSAHAKLAPMKISSSALLRRPTPALVPNKSVLRTAKPVRAVAVQPAVQAEDADIPAPELTPGTAGESDLPFNWFRYWWPVSPVNYLDKARPVNHTLFGREYVVWYNKATNTWAVQQDKCPHRFAPLSQGRIVDGGSKLMCSYHGWQFDTAGACTDIPQLPEAQKRAACSNPKSCVPSYPTRVEEGVLFFWPDASPEGVAASEQQGIAQTPATASWFMNGLGADFASMLEQGMDPTHANFLHHATGFDMNQVIPMEILSKSPVDKQTGFVVEHSAFEKRNKGLHAHRFFLPPYNNIIVYRQPTSTTLMHFMLVPTTPSNCRALGKLSIIPHANGAPDITITRDSADAAGSSVTLRGADAPVAEGQGGGAKGGKNNSSPFPAALRWAIRLGTALPHWMVNDHSVSDQDAVVVGLQERLMARTGLTGRQYHVPAADADAGVVATNKWLRSVGYPQTLYPPWVRHPGLTDPVDEVPLERMMDRYNGHVKYCVVCQQGLVTMTRVCIALTAAAVLAGAFAVATAAAGLVLKGSVLAAGAPLGWAVLGAGVLAWLAVKAWDAREVRFVSGARRWRRKGGVSLVAMPDL